MKKNILYVEQSRVGTVGGSHTCLLELVRGLNRAKYRAVVVFYEEHSLLNEFEDVADRVVVFRRPRMIKMRSQSSAISALLITPLFPLLMGIQKALNFLLLVRLFFEFIQFLKSEKIDLVHLNNTFYRGYDWLLASKLCGIKCVTHQRGFLESPTSGRFFIKLYDAIICVSEHIRRTLDRHYTPSERKIYVIYDGLNVETYQKEVRRDPVLVRRELGLKNGEPVIGIVGNIKPWKGQRIVIDAVSRLKSRYGNIRCVLIGSAEEDREYARSLRALVDSEGLESNVLFLGYRKDVADLIQMLDIFVHSSIDPEPFGRVLLEAMALGRPVVATGVGGPAEIIEDKVSGCLVRPDDADSMAEKIDYLLRHDDAREQMGRAAEERVKMEFAVEATVREIEQLYATLLGDG